MLHDAVDDPGARTEEELLAALADRLAEVIEAVGIQATVGDTPASESTVTAIESGDPDTVGDLDIEVGAAILALADDSPSAEDIVAAARDSLLFAMTTGVLSVDAVAGELSLDIQPREVQAMLEGRHPMTLREYVALQRVIHGRP